MTDKALARKLGDHYSRLRLDQVPPAVIEKARLVILDGLANGIEGWNTPISREVRAFTRNLENPRRKATVWADGFHASHLDAVFANTTLIHSLLHDDSLPGTSTHGGSMILPAALTLAEETGATGASALLAVIVGYDVQGRMGCMYKVAGPVVEKGHRGSPIFGPIAAAAAAAIVLGLDGERFAAAINLASNFSGGLLECQEQGSSEYRYQNAHAARSGVLAALLAKQGTPVAETTLDGRFGFIKVFAGLDEAPAEITAGLGEHYEILRTMRKPYPTCGNNIRIARTLQKAFKRRGVSHTDVAGVRLRVNPQTKNYPGCDFKGPFETLSQALMSTQFAVGSIARHGRLDAASYERFDDADVAGIAANVELVPDPGVRVGLYECKAVVSLRNGESFAADASPEDDNMFNPSRDEALKSFHDMACLSLPQAQRDGIVEAVLNLEKVRNVSKLTSALVLPEQNAARVAAGAG